MAEYTIFDDIRRGDLEAVKQRVLTDPAVLEEMQHDMMEMTPLMCTINQLKPFIAHWLIENRGEHDLNTQVWG